MGSNVILAIFPDEASADRAVQSLKDLDWADDSIKLDSIGVLVLDDSGKVKTHKVGTRSTTKGVGVGAVLALLTPVGLAAGVVGGAVVGALHHKGLGLSPESSQALADDLRDGKAAVGVLVHNDAESAEVSARLVELGGSPEAVPVDPAAVAAAAAETDAMFGKQAPAYDTGDTGTSAGREEISATVMQD